MKHSPNGDASRRAGTVAARGHGRVNGHRTSREGPCRHRPRALWWIGAGPRKGA